MADNDVLYKDSNATPLSFNPESTDQGSGVRRSMFGSKDGAQVSLGAKADAVPANPSAAASLIAVAKGIWNALLGTLNTAVFTPSRTSSNNPTTLALSVTATATAAPVALPACVATTYRVRNAPTSQSAITYVLSTSSSAAPVIPVAYAQAGTGGTAGDKTVDPGDVEIFGLTAAQQTALAAGTLYLAAICPGSGNGMLFITPGNGA